MSTKRLAIRGVMFNWLGRAVSFVVTFIVTPIIIHGLGDGAYGVWAIVMSVGAYYALADLGLRGASVKYIAQFKAVDDQESLGKVTATAFAAYSVLAAAALLISLPVAWCFPYLFDVGEHDLATIRLVVFLIGAVFAVRLLGQVFGATLNALKRFDVANVLSVTMQVLQAVLVIGAVNFGYGLLGMAYATLGVAILNQSVSALIAMRLLKHGRLSREFFDRSMLKQLLSFSILSVGISGARRVTQLSGTIIVGLFLGPPVAAFYAVAESLVRKSASLTKGLNSVVLPVASQLNAQKRYADLTKVLTQVPRVLFAMGLLIAVMLWTFGHPFLRLWIGPDYASSSYPILCVLAGALAAALAGGGLAPILMGADRLRPLVKLEVASAVMAIVGGSLLVWAMGAIGMAWALLVVRGIAHGLILPTYACKAFEYPWRRFARATYVPAFFAAIPAAAAGGLIVWLFPPEHLLVLAVQVGCTASLGAIGMFCLCLEQTTRCELVSIFRFRRRNSDQGVERASFGNE